MCSASHPTVARKGACSVRRLRFEVRDGHDSGDDGRLQRAREAERKKYNGGATATATVAAAATAAVSNAVPAEDSFRYDSCAARAKQREKSCGGPTTAALAWPPSSSLSSTPSPAVAMAAAAKGERDGEGDNHVSTNRSLSNTSTSTGTSGSTASEEGLGTTATSTSTIEICVAESVYLGGFFGTVWDCSLEMGGFLAGLRPGALRGKKVVELGAGCGAVSALCAALGASEVVATDEKDLLPLLAFNLERNKYQGFLDVKVLWGVERG